MYKNKYVCICIHAYVHLCINVCMYVCMYPKIYMCILVYGIHVYMYVLYNCICTYRYIYIYICGRLLSFAGGRFTAPAIQNGKLTCSKKARNWKRPFFEARWLVRPGQTLWNKCVFWCGYYCSSATVISVQLHDRNTGVASKICTWAKSVILPSPPHPTPPWSP